MPRARSAEYRAGHLLDPGVVSTCQRGIGVVERTEFVQQPLVSNVRKLVRPLDGVHLRIEFAVAGVAQQVQGLVLTGDFLWRVGGSFASWACAQTAVGIESENKMQPESTFSRVSTLWPPDIL